MEVLHTMKRSVARIVLLSFGVASISVTPSPALAAQKGSSPLTINHDPVTCVTATHAPHMDAVVKPIDIHQKSFVFFRAKGTEDFYYVVMEKTDKPEDLEGVLPRPLPDLKAIDYYLESRDKNAEMKQAGEYAASVTPDNICERKKGAPVDDEKGANLTIGLTKDTSNPVPSGFNKRDIAKVILVSGAVVTLAVALQSFTATGSTATAAASTTTAAASAGGISTLALVGGGAAIVGAGIAIGASGGSSSGNNAPTTPLSVTAVASPSSGNAPLAVNLSASPSGGTAPYSYTWTFGDNTATSTLQNPAHTYQNAGTFTYSVTVGDSANGRATASGSVTVSIAPLRFLEADVSWSGVGDLDIALLNPGGTSVGTRVPAGCESTGNRTERVILQTPAAGTYTITVKAASCPGATNPTSISGVVSGISDTGNLTACNNRSISVAIGQTVNACSVTIP